LLLFASRQKRKANRKGKADSHIEHLGKTQHWLHQNVYDFLGSDFLRSPFPQRYAFCLRTVHPSTAAQDDSLLRQCEAAGGAVRIAGQRVRVHHSGAAILLDTSRERGSIVIHRLYVFIGIHRSFAVQTSFLRTRYCILVFVKLPRSLCFFSAMEKKKRNDKNYFSPFILA